MAVSAAGRPAVASERWSWSTATHPNGSAHIPGGTVGGGLYRYHGHYYIPGVGHMAGTLGQEDDESVTGTGVLGRVSNTTYTGAPGNHFPDVSLVATGTEASNPIIRVSDTWPDAPLVDIAHPGDVATGDMLCQSGTSSETLAVGGYRCGKASYACNTYTVNCAFESLGGVVSSGDSGGPVWSVDGDGVKLYGWITGEGSGDSNTAVFEPIWALQNHEWKTTETWTDGGFPSGLFSDSCFITAKGCIRS